MAVPGRVELAGSAHAPETASAGDVDPDEPIEVTIVVRRQRPLPPYSDFAYRPRAPTTRVPRAEFARRHGASDEDLDQVRAFAREFELKLAERTPSPRSLMLSGSAKQLQWAFGTTLRRYRSPRGSYRGPAGPLTVPVSLAQVVTAVLGLDDRPVAVPHVRIPSTTPSSSFTPPQVAGLYGFPAQLDGSGQTIALVELGGGFASADLAAYFEGLGIPAPSVTAVSVDGGANQPGANPNTDAEVMLDIEVAGSVAPGARIVVYFAPNTDQGFIDAVSTAVHATEAPSDVVSISWGGPETSWTSQAAHTMLEFVSDAAALGVSVTAAAGDNGATDGASGGQLEVDLPACLPPVLGCGGTRLSVSGSTISNEVVWNELASGDGATGGGVSRIFPLPSYQSAAKVPPQPNTQFVGRGVPDVSGNADPLTGYAVRVDGKDLVVGGTSAVAPLWAALIARLNQALGRSLGMFQPAIYAAGEVPFRDILSGNNGYWSAGPGWDPCTGLGSPKGASLLNVLGPA